MKNIHIALLLFGTGVAFGQTAATLASSGYTAPAPEQVAPGQVVTLFFRGVGPLPGGELRSGQATSTPLPTNLAGLSAQIRQAQGPSIQVPLFAVRQESECDPAQAATLACLLTSIKLQLPFEIDGDISRPDSGPSAVTLAPVAQFTLFVDGQSGRSFPVQPIPDSVHVITSCDLTWDTKPSSVCDRHAYHADGTAVSASSPAKQGEIVSVYVFGLGKTSTPVRTGDPSPGGDKLMDVLDGARVKVEFSNFVNSLSSAPRSLDFHAANTPASPIAFAGLTAGQIGIYQLNIPIPSSFPGFDGIGTPGLFGPCGALDGYVRSNATLAITSSQGSENIGICVQP